MIEVLSKSTWADDRGEKVEPYRKRDSLAEYLLISQDRIHIDHYVRQPGHQWLLSETDDLHHTVPIEDAEEAKAYLLDSLLGDRLIEATEAVHAHLDTVSPVRLETLMGSRIDAVKLISSMTLFARAARELQQQIGEHRYARMADLAESVLAAARQQGFHPCRHTERALG